MRKSAANSSLGEQVARFHGKSAAVVGIEHTARWNGEQRGQHLLALRHRLRTPAGAIRPLRLIACLPARAGPQGAAALAASLGAGGALARVAVASGSARVAGRGPRPRPRSIGEDAKGRSKGESTGKDKIRHVSEAAKEKERRES